MGAQIIVPGNVGKDIEFFQFGQGGEGMKFDVAVTDQGRDGAETTRWYKIAVFGRTKDTAKQLHEDGKLVTGSKVLVMGAFNPRDYATRTGETRVSFDVTAQTVEVLHYPQRQQNAYPDTEGFEYADDDNDDDPGF